MTTTPRLGATEWAASQATPNLTVNEAIRKVEQGASAFIAKDKDLATPPGSPVNGDCYIVDATATGAWAGEEDSLAIYNSGWTFVTPIEGTAAYLQDENVLYRFNGTGWAVESSSGAVEVQDEGVTEEAAAAILNFTGAGVTVTGDGLGGATIDIPGGGGGSAPTIRNGVVVYGFQSTYALAFPSGTVAGDLAIIFIGHGYSINLPTGWTSLNVASGVNFNSLVAYRYLTTADITTGSVTITTPTAYFGVWSIVTLGGAAGGIRTGVYLNSGTGGASRSLATDGSPQTSDVAIYFAGNRSGTGATNTISLGTTLDSDGSTEAAGTLTAAAPAALGGLTPTFTFGSVSGGDFVAVVVVKA